MNSTLYGCLALSDSEIIDLPVPFGDQELVSRTGSHLPKKDASGSFILSSSNTPPSQFLPHRNEKVDFVGVGTFPQGADYAPKLMMLSNSEPNQLPIAELIYQRVFYNLQGVFLITISHTGPHSKFVILANRIQLYMLGVVNKEQCFLVWSNEEALEKRMKEQYQNKFLYYRFAPFSVGSLVLQTPYLCSRYRRWKREAKDNLHIFSALESFINNTKRTPESNL